MLKNLFLSLPTNIFIKLNFLREDYVGTNLNFDIFYNFFLGFTIAIGLTIISYLLGKKIYNLLFKRVNTLNINYLLYIALGYITFSTGIALLGFFSYLNPTAISLYLILILLISLHPFNKIRLTFNNIYAGFVKKIIHLKINKFIFIWLSLFIVLALINLINPEIREDQYHVDLPKIYLEQQTIMIPPKEGLRVSASPLLSEMTYLVGIFIWSEESARYIHFIFYILVLLTLIEFSKINNYKFSIYAPLLFATAPVVIHETSSMYVDFQWIFFFLLSILILIYNKKMLIQP